MPAKFIRTYKYTAPDGTQFDTLTEEQCHEMDAILNSYDGSDKPSLCAFLVGHGPEIVAILNQRERKHASPAAKVKRGRKSATPVEAA